MLKNCRAAGNAHHTRLHEHFPLTHTLPTPHPHSQPPLHTPPLILPLERDFLSVQCKRHRLTRMRVWRVAVGSRTWAKRSLYWILLHWILLHYMWLHWMQLNCLLFIQTHFTHRVFTPQDGYWREVCRTVRLPVHLRRAGACRLVHPGIAASCYCTPSNTHSYPLTPQNFHLTPFLPATPSPHHSPACTPHFTPHALATPDLHTTWKLMKQIRSMLKPSGEWVSEWVSRVKVWAHMLRVCVCVPRISLGCVRVGNVLWGDCSCT